MPYKKPERVPFQGFSEFLKGRGFNSVKLAEVLGCSPNTAMKKLKEPKLFDLNDLLKIHRRAHIVWDDIRKEIGG